MEQLGHMGRIRHPGRGDDATVNHDVTNSATVSATTGDLIVTVGGSGTLISSGGTWTAAATRDIEFKGTGDFEGMFNGSGAGTVTFVAPGVRVSTNDVTFNITNGGVQWDHDGLAEISLQGNQFTNDGLITFTHLATPNAGSGRRIQQDGTFENAGTFNHDAPNTDVRLGEGSTATGQTFLNSGTFNFRASGGSDDGEVNIVSGSNVLFRNTGTVTKSIGTGDSRFLGGGGRTFENDGIVQVDSGALVFSGLNVTSTNAATWTAGPGTEILLTNVPTQGTFNGSGAGVIGLGGSGITLSGDTTFDVTGGGLEWDQGGAGVVTLSGNTFTNQGILRVDSGTLEFQGAGELASVNAASWTAGPGTAIILDNVQTQGTFTGSGAGVVRLGGNVTLSADTTFNFTGGGVTWDHDSGAEIFLSGDQLTNQGTLTFTHLASPNQGSGRRIRDNGTFENAGTFDHDAPNTDVRLGEGSTGQTFLNSGTFNFKASGTDDGEVNFAGGSNASFENTGTVNKSAGTGTSRFFVGGGSSHTFSNSGTVQVSSGELEITSSAQLSVPQVSGSTLSGGTWIAAGTGTLDLQPANPGVTTIGSAATVVLEDSGSFLQIEQTGVNGLETVAGTFVVNGSSNFTVSNDNTNPNLLIVSGTIGGSGTVTGDLNVSGTISPGDPNVGVGTLTIMGDTALASGGSISMEIVDPLGMAGTDFDFLDVSGSLTLPANWTLNADISVIPETLFESGFKIQFAAANSLVNFAPNNVSVNAFGQSVLGDFSVTDMGTGNALFLQFSLPIPEPTTVIIAALGFLGMGWLGWRRRKRA